MPASAGIILLVEDDAEILEELAHSLRRRNYHVVTAMDFDGCLQALADHDKPPDVLLTDVNLPGGNGLALLDHVNRRPPPLPRVILMTGHLDDVTAAQALRDGAEAVLLKPFSLSVLLKQLKQVAVPSSAAA